MRRKLVEFVGGAEVLYSILQFGADWNGDFVLV